MPYLVSKGGEKKSRTITLSAKPCVLGRSSSCDVVLDSDSVSRRHARLAFSGRGYFVEDLGSRNGTLLNNEVIRGRVQLADGDQLRLSRFEFRYYEELSPADSPDPIPSPTEDTAVWDPRALSETDTYFRLDASAADTGRFNTAAVAKLGCLLEITQALGKYLALDRLLPQVLESLFKVLPEVERGCIVLRDESGNLKPAWGKLRKPTLEPLRVSRAIVDRVMEQKEAVVSSNAAADPRFGISESAASFRFRSVMCAPLIDDDGEAFGVIQVDGAGPQAFTEEDLSLLMATSSQAAIAITVTRLHDQLVNTKTVERDLELAAIVQRDLLPHGVPEVDGYTFADYYEPAEQVGGDYFDYIHLPDGRLMIVIADVVGHGIPAALTMSKFSAEARFLAGSWREVADTLNALNAAIYQHNPRQLFVTCQIVVIDPRAHQVTIGSAGHHAALQRHKDGTIVERGRESMAPPLGTVEDVVFEQFTFDLASGDVLVLYTDGLVEAMCNKEVYGPKRLAREVTAATSTRDVVSRLVDDLDRFYDRAPRKDDVCIVAIGWD